MPVNFPVLNPTPYSFKSIFLALLFSLSAVLLRAQDFNTVVREYRLSYDSHPQSLVLTEYGDGYYFGYMEIKISKGRLFWTRFGRFWRDLWDIKTEELLHREVLPSDEVQKIMNRFHELGIEDLEICSAFGGECNQQWWCCGCPYTLITVRSGQKNKRYYYDAISPIEQEHREVSTTLKRVELLVTALLREFPYDEIFAEYRAKLPKGRYYWANGAGITILCKKK